MGGKSRQAKRLAAILADHKCYVEVFAGAANLLFVKPPSKTEVINDINSDLVNLFRIVRYHSREFIAELNCITQSREEFADYRSQPGLTDIQRAARFWFVAKTAFGGTGGTTHPSFGYGTTGKSRLRRSSFSAIRRCHKRLDGVYIENLDFEDLIKRYDRKHTIFFCDPPYYKTAGFAEKFDGSDHERLSKALRAIKGKFLLTINDDQKIRKLYKGLPRRSVQVKYSVARDKSAKARDRKELLISNYCLKGGLAT